EADGSDGASEGAGFVWRHCLSTALLGQISATTDQCPFSWAVDTTDALAPSRARRRRSRSMWACSSLGPVPMRYIGLIVPGALSMWVSLPCRVRLGRPGRAVGSQQP